MKHVLPSLVAGAGLLAMSCFTANRNTVARPVAPTQFKRVINTTYVTGSGCTVEKFRIYSPSRERDIKAVAEFHWKYFQNRESVWTNDILFSSSPTSSTAVIVIDQPKPTVCF
jgi:hypothetical protein